MLLADRRFQVQKYWRNGEDERLQITPKLHVPELRFDSDPVWVDAAANAVYITYQSHLLRMLLPQ